MKDWIRICLIFRSFERDRTDLDLCQVHGHLKFAAMSNKWTRFHPLGPGDYRCPWVARQGFPSGAADAFYLINVMFDATTLIRRLLYHSPCRPISHSRGAPFAEVWTYLGKIQHKPLRQFAFLFGHAVAIRMQNHRQDL